MGDILIAYQPHTMICDKVGFKTRVMRFIWDHGDYYVEAAGCRARPGIPECENVNIYV